jgi:hypothetical protein
MLCAEFKNLFLKWLLHSSVSFLKHKFYYVKLLCVKYIILQFEKPLTLKKTAAIVSSGTLVNIGNQYLRCHVILFPDDFIPIVVVLCLIS